MGGWAVEAGGVWSELGAVGRSALLQSGNRKDQEAERALRND